MLGALKLNMSSLSLLSSPPPAPSQQSLTFCEATVGSLQGWLDTLPKANLGETARQLYQGVIEVNRLHTPAGNRLNLLELLRTEVHSVSKNLERYFLDQPVALDQRAHKVATLCMMLQSHLATGYKQVLVSISGSRERSQLLAPALQRAIRSLYAALVRSIQLYGPPPDNFWLDLHELYLIAMQEGIQHRSVRDKLAYQTDGMSIEQSYLAALLLGIAHCNRLRRRHVGVLSELLENWSSLPKLQKASALGSTFIILTDTNVPPRHSSLAQKQNIELSGFLGIDTHPLTDAIHDYLIPDQKSRSPVQLNSIEQLDKDLLQRLYLVWSEVAERTAKRIPGSGTLNACIGMTAAHYYLSGKRSFTDLLNNLEATRSASFRLGSSDVWDQPYDTGGEHDPWIGGSEQIGYQPTGLGKNESADQSSAFPCFELSVVNQSIGGYCLAWNGPVPEQLQVGELLGLNLSSDQGWQLAVVRWIYLVTQENRTQMGIQLLAQQAEPCGAKLMLKEREGSQYLRALLLPENPIHQTPSLLLLPLLPFQEGHKVRGIRNGQEFRCTLTHRHSGTSSYNLFEYQMLEAPQPEAALSTTQAQDKLGSTTAEPPKDDFDSLWKSL